MDNKNPTGIKKHDTSCKQSESITNKEKKVKTSVDEPNNNNNKKKIFIFGDSMVKNFNGWSISEKLKRKHNVYVRFFSGSKVRCMKDYAKPCIRVNDPDHIIHHLGTNDLNSEKRAQLCSKSIVDLAKGLTSGKRKVTIFGIMVIDHGKRINLREHF